MPRLNPRLAAGVGVLTAFLLLGGPAAAAIAYPGGGYSDRGHSSDGGDGHGNYRGGDGDRHGSDHRNGRGDGNDWDYDRGDGSSTGA